MMDLESRIELLERQNRRMKRLGLAALMIVGILACMGQSKPQPAGTLTAEKFVVVDAKGQARATLGMQDGSPQFTLTNSRGQNAVLIEVPATPDKPAIYLRDPQESAMLELAMTMNGPVIHLTDKSGVRARLATNELNAPLVGVYSAVGHELFIVTDKKNAQ
jgi:hypothetical protein